MHIKWTRQALTHLEREVESIARDNPQAAGHVVKHIQKDSEKFGRINMYGMSGKLPGFTLVGSSDLPYIIAYRIRKDTVEIVQVLHSARETPKIFQ